MNSDHRTDPEPDPGHLAAWADGELNRADAERVEAWLARHPDADEAGRLVRLYRDHPPPEPSELAWQAALTIRGLKGRIEFRRGRQSDIWPRGRPPVD